MAILGGYLSALATDVTPNLAFATLFERTPCYYLHNREKVEAYLLEWLEYGRQAREEQRRNPPPVVLRMQALKAERQRAATALWTLGCARKRNPRP
jgi:hypothetical protein